MENNENVEKKEVPEKEQYMQGIVGELMADQDWDFPPDERFFLVADLDWTLLGR